MAAGAACRAILHTVFQCLHCGHLGAEGHGYGKLASRACHMLMRTFKRRAAVDLGWYVDRMVVLVAFELSLGCVALFYMDPAEAAWAHALGRFLMVIVGISVGAALADRLAIWEYGSVFPDDRVDARSAFDAGIQMSTAAVRGFSAVAVGGLAGAGVFLVAQVPAWMLGSCMGAAAVSIGVLLTGWLPVWRRQPEWAY